MNSNNYKIDIGIIEKIKKINVSDIKDNLSLDYYMNSIKINFSYNGEPDKTERFFFTFIGALISKKIMDFVNSFEEHKKDIFLYEIKENSLIIYGKDNEDKEENFRIANYLKLKI